MRFTNQELEARLLEHKRNANSGLQVQTWNKAASTVETSKAHYAFTQTKLANMIEELLKYRESDPNYKEE